MLVIIIIHTPGNRHRRLTRSIITTFVVHVIVTIAIIVTMIKIPKRYYHVDESRGQGRGRGPELDLGPDQDQDIDRDRGIERGESGVIHVLDQGLDRGQGLVEREGERGLDQDRDRGPDLWIDPGLIQDLIPDSMVVIEVEESLVFKDLITGEDSGQERLEVGGIGVVIEIVNVNVIYGTSKILLIVGDDGHLFPEVCLPIDALVMEIGEEGVEGVEVEVEVGNQYEGVEVGVTVP